MKTSRHPNASHIASVSTATMKTDDLIPSFLWELEHMPNRSKEHFNLCRSINSRMKADSYYESKDSDYDLESLFDALECYAPQGFYFGAHPGDGSDYGLWLCEDFVAEFDGLKVDDLSEVPTGYAGEVLLTNDHGNMTLYAYHRNHHVTVLWSIV